MTSFSARDATIYRPYPDEIPWELLLAAEPDEARAQTTQAQMQEYADAEYMRVAKFEDEVIGAYVVEALTPLRFALKNLVVAGHFRRKGLGGWLLGHAIGLAESKGAREIFVSGAPLRGLFARVGFANHEGGLLLTLTPE